MRDRADPLVRRGVERGDAGTLGSGLLLPWIRTKRSAFARFASAARSAFDRFTSLVVRVMTTLTPARAQAGGEVRRYLQSDLVLGDVCRDTGRTPRSTCPSSPSSPGPPVPAPGRSEPGGPDRSRPRIEFAARLSRAATSWRSESRVPASLPETTSRIGLPVATKHARCGILSEHRAGSARSLLFVGDVELEAGGVEHELCVGYGRHPRRRAPRRSPPRRRHSRLAARGCCRPPQPRVVRCFSPQALSGHADDDQHACCHQKRHHARERRSAAASSAAADRDRRRDVLGCLVRSVIPIHGGPGRTRTCNQGIMSPLLRH